MMMVIPALLFTTVGCSKEEVVQQQAIPVQTVTIKPTTMANQTKLVGEITSNDEVLVSTKIPGKISKVYVNVGDSVKAGDLLFELENQDLKAAVEQAQKSLSIAQANLANIRNGARPQEREQTNQAVNQAKIQLDLATTNFERMKELFEADAVSKQQYDQALSGLQLAEAAYKSAVEKLSLVEEGASQDTIRAAEAQVGLAQANLKMAQAKLNDTRIHSPIDGRVGFVKFDSGEFVMQGNPVVQVLDDQMVTALVDVSEKEISSVHPQAQVQVEIPSAAIEPYTGVVTEVSPTIDPQTKVYPIKILINNLDGKIKSGMTANVLFTMERKEKIIAIPVDATFEELGEHYVYLVKDGKAVKTQVQTGITDGKQVEIIEGLKEGDSLIIKGQNMVKNGDLVNKGGEAL